MPDKPTITTPLKIIFLTSRFPYPLEKGDKLRAYHQIRELAKNHEIHLISVTDSTIPKEYIDKVYDITTHIYIVKLTPWERYLSLLRCLRSKRPFQTGWFYSPQAAKIIKNTIEQIEPDHILCQLPRMAEYVTESKTPKTIDYMDSFGIGMLRRSQVAGIWTSWLYKLEARRMLKYEEHISGFFDHMTIISGQDKNNFVFPDKDKMEIVPNGIDHSFFHYQEGIEATYDIVFVGNMGYLPNIEAAEYIVKNILPLCPDNYKICISGATPAKRVLELAGERVHIRGWLDDIRTAYTDGRVFVTPMWSGTGQQNKILEAMALGVPCVTTQLVNNAIGARPNEEILIAETKEDFAKYIQELTNDPVLYEKIRFNAIKFVKEHFSWEQSTYKLSSIIQS
jgi:glycosyltransferase involved in cell wall biosynthesis